MIVERLQELSKPLFDGSTKSPLFVRKVGARMTNVGHPFNAVGSKCGGCGCRFFIAKAHFTPYGDGGGASYALCEACWQNLIPEERLPHYRDIYGWWITHVDNSGFTSWKQAWQEMEIAVLAGL